MFHWRDEGEAIEQGLSIYPLSSPYHAGGYLAIGRLRFYVRWAKKHRRLHWSVNWVPRDNVNVPRAKWS